MEDLQTQYFIFFAHSYSEYHIIITSKEVLILVIAR